MYRTGRHVQEANAHNRNEAGDHLDDPRGQAMRDAMWKGHGGYELALVPAFFGVAGWVADDFLGTVPFLTILGVVLGLIGSVMNQYYRYKTSMEIATEERRAATEAKSVASGRTFGAVEREEVDMTVDFGRLDDNSQRKQFQHVLNGNLDSASPDSTEVTP